MPLLNNIQNVAFASQYSPDKIVSSEPYTGSFTASGSAGSFGLRTHVTIPHTFGASCFLSMVYSTNNGTTWQEMGTAIPDLTTPSAPIFQTLYVTCYSTTTEFVIVASNYRNTNPTVLYRMVAIWMD